MSAEKITKRPDRPIYLDNQATTPTDQRVIEAMRPYFEAKFGNPHSSSHFYGWEADEAVAVAREKVAALIGADPKEIIFTSGATESNNLAIKGVARLNRDHRGHLVTCVTEHTCVLESMRALEREGFEVTYLAVDSAGMIDLDELSNAITDKTALVSIMAVHNEIGVIQPLAEIGAICRQRKVVFHTDAAQAAGKIPLDVGAMKIDLMSITAHKFYGPMGIGALYVGRRPRVRLAPMFSGGEQERGIRPGTLPAPLCVGLGEACRLAQAEMGTEAERLRMLRGKIHDALTTRLVGVAVNGDLERRIPGNLNFSFAGVEAENLMAALRDLAVSSGSACTSASAEPSYSLRALGIGDERAQSSLRIGIGRFTTEHEVDYAIERIVEEVQRLRDAAEVPSAPGAEPETETRRHR